MQAQAQSVSLATKLTEKEYNTEDEAVMAIDDGLSKLSSDEINTLSVNLGYGSVELETISGYKPAGSETEEEVRSEVESSKSDIDLEEALAKEQAFELPSAFE